MAAVVPRTLCGPPRHLTPETAPRTKHYAESVRRRRRVLTITATIAAAVNLSLFGMTIATAPELWPISLLQLGTGMIFFAIPLLHRFGELVAPLTFILTAFVSLTIVCWNFGTGSGIQFYFLVGATVAVLILGIEHILLACILVATGAGITIALQFLVPVDTGAQEQWATTTGFVVSVISACVMTVAAVWYALREIERAEHAMEQEYDRSETLLANILPTSIAERLKNPDSAIIADDYEDASVLFADIAGYTERASQTTPADLVAFLNRLYTEFDGLVEQHGLEKIKTSGDSYIVVSGVPEPRPDHLKALTRFALAMADAIGGMRDQYGRTVPLRIGMATGPVVAGVIGTRRFFYDVWGDAVNVASRMESTGVEGRIQVPQQVYESLRDDFDFESRGAIEVKGKGVMRTWFLAGERDTAPAQGKAADDPATLVTPR